METWTNGQNNIQPWQTVPEQMKQLGLTDEDGMEKAWFVTKNGDLFGGAEAVNQAMRSCWWAKPITYLYYLPGIRQLQDWGYQWIAKNRHHLPGSTASCKIDIDLE